MPALSEIADDLVKCLQRRKAAGDNCVYLSPAVRQEFFTPIASTAPQRTVSRPRPSKPAPEKPAPPPASLGVCETPETTVVPVEPIPADLDLDGLAARVASCRQCPLCRRRKQAVFARGNPDADLMFVGEGPGAEEDQQGLPFVGPAGQLLDKMIGAMQFARDEVYIANIVKCRPPGNRAPEEAEAEACLPYLQRQIELVQPRALVLLGGVALKYLLGKTGVNRLHGNWFECHGIPAMATFHPSYLLRVPQKKRDAWSDLQKVMARFGKDPSDTVKQR
jgi:DNA polymerase